MMRPKSEPSGNGAQLTVPYLEDVYARLREEMEHIEAQLEYVERQLERSKLDPESRRNIALIVSRLNKQQRGRLARECKNDGSTNAYRYSNVRPSGECTSWWLPPLTKFQRRGLPRSAETGAPWEEQKKRNHKIAHLLGLTRQEFTTLWLWWCGRKWNKQKREMDYCGQPDGYCCASEFIAQCEDWPGLALASHVTGDAD